MMSCLLCTVEVVRLMERVSFYVDPQSINRSNPVGLRTVGGFCKGLRKDMYEAAARAAVLLMTRSSWDSTAFHNIVLA
eukprot:scaffold25602_cov119-Skeletonema_dohrnii-CCMP3373.AAC.1